MDVWSVGLVLDLDVTDRARSRYLPIEIWFLKGRSVLWKGKKTSTGTRMETHISRKSHRHSLNAIITGLSQFQVQPVEYV